MQTVNKRAFAAPAISWDTFGMAASSLCAVHCMVMPLLLLALPAFSFEFLEGPAVHRLLAVGVLAFCLLALVPGFVKHRNKWILGGMLAGLTLVVYSSFGEIGALEVPIISLGNAILITTHFFNRKMLHMRSKHHNCCL